MGFETQPYGVITTWHTDAEFHEHDNTDIRPNAPENGEHSQARRDLTARVEGEPAVAELAERSSEGQDDHHKGAAGEGRQEGAMEAWQASEKKTATSCKGMAKASLHHDQQRTKES